MIHFKKTCKKKFWQSLGVISLTTFALLVTGTFAWQSIDQLATNKFKGGINPGARLHDDFNGENKDIYVENFTSPEDGAQVFARIKLKEYMEIGPTAGKILGDKEAETSPSLTIVGKEDANINDFSTWHTHSFEPNSEAELAFRNYWSWTMGNTEGEELYYMPTFNKDNESLDADINGSLEGTGDKVVDTTTGDVGKGDGTPYNDYTEWKTGVNKKGVETLNRGEEGEEVTHTTQKIDYNATVMSMEQWVAQGKKVGPYWVYDKDGWAYWAQAINPGETTGLLLNRVEKNQMPSDNYYYGIHVIGQFATAGDWSGFEDDITSQGEELLNVVANRMPQVVYMTPTNGAQQYAVVGSDLQLQVNVNVQNAPSDEAEAAAFIEKAKKAVQWTINDENFSNTVHENIFTPTEEMAGKTYTLTARSKITPSVTTSLTVRILPLGVDGNEVIVGEDGENYISFGYNVYKRLEADGSLSNFICAGRDEKIGNSDDQLNVYDMISEVGKADVTYGRFYIKKADNRYYAMGEDEKLGTADDIVVCSATNKWPENISNKVADRVVVKTANGETTDVQVKIGQTTQFVAEVYLANQLSSNQKVKWTIEGNKSSDTKITEDGLLIIGIDEPVNNYIRVFAAAEDAEAYAKNNLLVKTSPLGYEDIPTVEVQSTTTVKIGDYNYYVLANDGEKALLWAKDSGGFKVYNGAISSYDYLRWDTSDLRENLNSSWLDSQPDILKENVIETEIFTTYNAKTSGSIVKTMDKVFLLSVEDINGLTGKYAKNDQRLLTMGEKIKNLSKLSGGETLLRSMSGYPNGSSLKEATIFSLSGAAIIEYTGANYYNGNKPARPAFWVYLPGKKPVIDDEGTDTEEASEVSVSLME